MWYSLAGEMRQRLGVAALISDQSSSVTSASASCAMAVRCSTVLDRAAERHVERHRVADGLAVS